MPYQVNARNYSESNENRIHSDEVAQKLGFTGALVPGVAVYGMMARAFVDHYGTTWLSEGHDHLRLIKPAYHEDRLTVALDTHTENNTANVSATNAQGTHLATITEGAADERFDLQTDLSDGAVKATGRPTIAWNNVTPGERLTPWTLSITSELNQKYATEADDTNSLYQDYAHPHLICSIANTALTREYTMPAWIHVGTETKRYAAVEVGDEIDITSKILDRWEKKGHEFLQVGVQLTKDAEVKTEMRHTAIFKIAGL